MIEKISKEIDSLKEDLIDDLRKVKEIFFNFQQVEFKSALEGSSQDKKDGVLILKRGGK